MSMWQRAQRVALEKAAELEREAAAIGIMRSVDATQSSRWLLEMAQAIREACGPEMPEEGS